MGAMPDPQPSGVLLVNLGTPDSTSVPDVRRYLRQFLSDPRVIDIHPVTRWLLLNLIVLPRRPANSAHAYEQIWMEEGSPLLVHGNALRKAVASRLGDEADVRLAMRYGKPSIGDGLDGLVRDGIDRVLVVPMWPHYASATIGSTVQAAMEHAARMWNTPQLAFTSEFYDDPGYIEALAERSAKVVEDADHVVIAYHGLPQRQVRKSDMSGAHCLATPNCCDAIGLANRRCYRAQCHATSRRLIEALGLPADKVTTAFQSQFGRDPWIQPYADEAINALATKGYKKVAVIEPGFVADCLETLEEIGVRAAEDFMSNGGDELLLAPCLNATELWADAVARMVRDGSPWLRSAATD